MNLVAATAYWALETYKYVMIVALIFNIVRGYNPSYRARPPMLYIAVIAFALTDAPVRLLRKIIKPLHFGGMYWDFAWLALFLLLGLVQSLVARFI